MASSPSEHEIQQRIRLVYGRETVRLWRNNTGALVDQQGRFVRFGLCKGSSDLIGLRSLDVTPEMLGQGLAQFVALESRQPSFHTHSLPLRGSARRMGRRLSTQPLGQTCPGSL